MAQERIMAESAPISGTVAAPEGSQQVLSGEVKSPIPGMPQDVFGTLNRYHSRDVIEKQRALHKTHEDFLLSARQEAERIKLARSAQQEKSTENGGKRESLNSRAQADIEHALGLGSIDKLGQLVVDGEQIPGVTRKLTPVERYKVSLDEVRRNASPDVSGEQRLQRARELLEVSKFSEKQERAILQAHKVGEDRPGAGVFKYDPKEISEKTRILREAGFDEEQTRALLKSGLAGRLPPPEVARLFNSVTFAAHPLLKNIADATVLIGVQGNLNEQALDRQLGRVENLLDSGNLTDPAHITLAQQLYTDLQSLRSAAEQTASVAPARSPRALSPFEQGLVRLENARNTGNRAAETAELNSIRALYNEIDALRNRRGERLDLLRVARDPLIGIYYDSRVGVGQKERLGVDEYRGQGTLEKLSTLQRVLVDPAILADDRTGRTTQMVQESKIFRGEDQEGYWNSPDIAAIENLPEVIAFKQRHGMNTLAEGLRGYMDYYNREGLAMVTEAVRNRKALLPDNGLHDAWTANVKNKMGRLLKDADGVTIRTQNFNEVREVIEGARCQDPWVPNRGDYETWIQFVADDVEELREMAPYIILKVVRKLGTGEEQAGYQTLTQEIDKMYKGLAVYPFETEGEFRMAKSEIAGDFNLEGDYFFSDRVRKGWDGFFHFSEFIASSCQDTELQNHFGDAVLLDKYGETMLALEELCKEDGILFRYGEKSDQTANKANNVADLYRWQKRRKKDIEKQLMNQKLRTMDDLLNLTLDQDRKIIGRGMPNHPAFRRLKNKYDRLDAADRLRTRTQEVFDADGNRTLVTRWQEYCEKAMLWQDTGEFGDPREAERVTFQHPLARTLRPKDFKDVNGVVTTVDELDDMFETDNRVNNDRAYAWAKRRRVKKTLDKSEKIIRAFLVDSSSALAWFTFNKDLNVAKGDTRTKTAAERLAEVNKYLQDAGMNPIAAGEAVPHKTLYRAMMQALLREDANKHPAQKRFKFYYMLNKMGFDLDLPTNTAWNMGSHDTNRPAFMLDVVYNDIVQDAAGNEVGLAKALSDSVNSGLDEKNTGAKWAEDERRMGLLMQLVIRQMFPKYFNYPGHDTKGAGVKDIRNVLDPIYGISARTSWISDLTSSILLGEQDPAKDYGASRSPLRQWLGLVKGGDEVIFRQTGYAGIIESPRDMESWVNRFKSVVGQYESLTKGGKDGGPGLLKSGPFSGMFLWRDYSLGGLGKNGKYESDHSSEKFFAINKADEAIIDMKESTYRSGIELAGKTAGNLANFMKQNIESTFGRNPESRKFLNTLWWFAASKWMDTSPEYRARPGYAVDGNLHLARYFIHTFLQEEEGLIYSDTEWDQIMLGYTRIKKSDGTFEDVTRYKTIAGNTVRVEYNNQGRIVKENGVLSIGSTVKYDNGVTGIVLEHNEGLIDSFPKDIRDEILTGRDMPLKDSKGNIVIKNGKAVTYKDYILPFGLLSKYPETFVTYHAESPQGQEDYKGALSQIRPRKVVIRS